jgi:type IV secretory pathway TraG/TraD family ATPase VirD4
MRWTGSAVMAIRKEEDIVAVATCIMTDNARTASARDDFYRASAMQLLTALIADVCLSGHTDEKDQTLRRVRANLSKPEPQLRTRPYPSQCPQSGGGAFPQAFS